MKDYYKILGVEEEASENEIRARWIELTKHYHPDLGKTEEVDEKIREINEAYEILKNEATRSHYDFERDLKKSFFKKADRRQERRMNILKIFIIPSSGVLVLFLIIGFFFDESKALRYQVEEKKIEIYQNRVEVKARFRVEQILKKEKKEMVWAGNIRWVLAREDGTLKIVSLDYQKARYVVTQVLKRGGEKRVLKGCARWVLIKENGILKILSIDYKHDKTP